MAIVDDIKGRLDILDVVSQHTALQRSGRSYKANCPFHTERTPSFFVFPERQSWRCFGACATGGDIFSFVMRIENLDFSEALKQLAQQAGIALPEGRDRDRGEGDLLNRVNETAAEFFHRQLTSERAGASARAYLEKRGVTPESIQRFQLGLSPGDGESLKGFLASKGYGIERLASAGLVTQGQRGGYRDMFRQRLMFPIWDPDGKIVGFGGRAQGDSQPKYLNTPRTGAFDKGSILYALHMARDSVRERGIVIVEGYMDAITAHQNGFTNVVASMGTALTQQQVSLVRGLVRRPGADTPGEVVLALDADAAGQEATLRSLESSWMVFQRRQAGRAQNANIYQRPDGPELKVAPLPEGKDPDEVIAESPDAWAGLIGNAVPLFDYLFTAYSSRVDLNTPQGKATLADKLSHLVWAAQDSFQQDHYFQRLAGLLGVNEATLRASLGRPRTPPRAQTPARAGASSGPQAATTPFERLDHDPLEEYCLALILQDPLGLGFAWDDPQEEEEAAVDASQVAQSLRLEYFRRVENREVFTNLTKCSTLESLRGVLDQELLDHLDHLLNKPLPPSDRKERQAALADSVRRLEERHLRELKLEEELRLSQASTEEQEQRILQVNERLRQVFRKQESTFHRE